MSVFHWGLKAGLTRPENQRFRLRYYGITVARWFVGVAVVERNPGENFLGKQNVKGAHK